MENEFKLATCENCVDNFPALACVCGLSFPDSANEFQKSILTLAHLMAALRESVLKGAKIPADVVDYVVQLANVAYSNSDAQI